MMTLNAFEIIKIANHYLKPNFPALCSVLAEMKKYATPEEMVLVICDEYKKERKIPSIKHWHAFWQACLKDRENEYLLRDALRAIFGIKQPAFEDNIYRTSQNVFDADISLEKHIKHIKQMVKSSQEEGESVGLVKLKAR